MGKNPNNHLRPDMQKIIGFLEESAKIGTVIMMKTRHSPIEMNSAVDHMTRAKIDLQAAISIELKGEENEI